MANKKHGQVDMGVEVRGLRPDDRAPTASTSAEGESETAAAAEAKLDPEELIKVRVRSGRIMMSREFLKNAKGEIVDAADKFADVGDVIEMKRGDAKKLLERRFDGYPNHDGQPGKFGGVVRDSPIELVQQL